MPPKNRDYKKRTFSKKKVHFYKEKGSQKGSQTGGSLKILTEAEQQVLSLLTEAGLSVTAIALRRETSKSAVYKIRRSLIEKGYLKQGFTVEGSQGGGIVNHIDADTIRLHGVQWRVGFLGGLTARPRVLPEFMGCHVVVHQRFLEIYSKAGLSWSGVDEWSCFALAMGFFSRLANKLEYDLKVPLIKDRCQNWELVKSEWATEGSSLAKRCLSDDVSLKVFGTVDGKLWFWGDWSKQSPEHETSRKVDSELVNRHLNDWRDWSPPTNSELAGTIKLLLRHQEVTAQQLREQGAALSAVLELLKPRGREGTGSEDVFDKNSREWYFG